METSIVKRERRDTKNNGTFNIHQFQYALATAAKSGERKRNKKTHNKGHILDRQIKHASEYGASDQISQWMVKIWTVGIRR